MGTLHFYGHSYVHAICISYRLAGRICTKQRQNFAVKILLPNTIRKVTFIHQFMFHFSLKKNYIRFIGLKAPIIPSITSTGRNQFISTMVSLQVDNLLNPLAILFCYYSSVIFLRDILKESPEKIKSDSVPLQTVNGIDFLVDLFFFCFVGLIITKICNHPNYRQRQHCQSNWGCQNIYEAILLLYLPA